MADGKSDSHESALARAIQYNHVDIYSMAGHGLKQLCNKTGRVFNFVNRVTLATRLSSVTPETTGDSSFSFSDRAIILLLLRSSDLKKYFSPRWAY